jgi:hypothetical protein
MARNKKDVGRSERTPVKHALMDAIAGKEMGLLVSKARDLGIKRALWIDLTSGDAALQPGMSTVGEWRKNCSPGILAHHARWVKCPVPIRIDLYEIADGQFSALISNLTRWLPELGYEKTSEFEWRHKEKPVFIYARNKSGFLAELPIFGDETAVFVTHDPNHIKQWAMRENFTDEIRVRTRWLRSITTMGCNVGGIKRFDRNERDRWFSYVESIADNLYRHHELFLCAINGDAAQWAYLIEESGIKDHMLKLEELAHTKFNDAGLTIRHAWYRRSASIFEDRLRELFLTRDERAA